MYVFDRAYSDITFWLKIIAADFHFATCLKDRSIALLKDGKKSEAKKKDGVLYDGTYRPHPQSLVNTGIAKERRKDVDFQYVFIATPRKKYRIEFLIRDVEETEVQIEEREKGRCLKVACSILQVATAFFPFQIAFNHSAVNLIQSSTDSASGGALTNKSWQLSNPSGIADGFAHSL